MGYKPSSTALTALTAAPPRRPGSPPPGNRTARRRCHIRRIVTVVRSQSVVVFGVSNALAGEVCRPTA